MKRRSLFNRRVDGEEESSDAINMTPLIDMMFILLIFFVVTTSFVRESAVAVQRPKAATATPAKHAAVIVTITADEQIWLNNAAVDIRLLRARLEQLGLAGPTRSAVILADTQASTGLLVKTMDQLRLAGFVNISVAASAAPDQP
jgi:biopolymer transport protein ExbD